MNFFDSLEHLEPKCPTCRTILDYGVNTEFNDEEGAHVCVKCDSVLN